MWLRHSLPGQYEKACYASRGHSTARAPAPTSPRAQLKCHAPPATTPTRSGGAAERERETVRIYLRRRLLLCSAGFIFCPGKRTSASKRDDRSDASVAESSVNARLLGAREEIQEWVSTQLLRTSRLQTTNRRCNTRTCSLTASLEQPERRAPLAATGRLFWRFEEPRAQQQRAATRSWEANQQQRSRARAVCEG